MMRWFKLIIFLTLMALGFFLRSCSAPDVGTDTPTPPPFQETSFVVIGVDSIAPSSSPTSGGSVVTILGNGFTPQTVVLFNNTPSLNVKWISGKELRVLVPPNLGTKGIIPVEFINHHLSKDDHYIFNGHFSYYLSTLAFSKEIPITNMVPSILKAVDLKGNGTSTLLTDQINQITGTIELNQFTFNSVSKNFDKKVLLPLPNRIATMASTDVNTDGKIDVMIGMTYKDVIVCFNDGIGGLLKFTTLSTLNYKIKNLILDDFNNDQTIDIAVITGNYIGSFLNKGNTFVPTKLSFAANTPINAFSVLYDKGEYKDLLVQDGENINLLRSNENGSFQAPMQLSFFSKVGQMVKADWNQDHLDDLGILFTIKPVQLQTLLNVENNFPTNINISTPTESNSIWAVDMNGDQILDMVDGLFSTSDQGMAIFIGLGDGNFLEPQYFYSPPQSIIEAIADMNGDLQPDIIVHSVVSGNEQISLLLNESK